MKKQSKTRTMVQMAVLAAMSVLLVYLVHFPIFPSAVFLEYDPADIPVFIGGFMLGPVCGLIITAIACVVQGLTVSAASGPIGILMHFVATGSFVLVSGLIYKKMHNRKGAAISLVCGTIVWLVVMVIWNILVTPFYMGVPREAVLAMILPVIIPFNLIKAGGNALITFFVYKPLSKIMRFEVKNTDSKENDQDKAAE